MRIVVSHGTVTVNGQRPCSRCGGPRPAGRKDRYCQDCRRDYTRGTREGMIQALLTPEEWGLILERRAGPVTDLERAAGARIAEQILERRAGPAGVQVPRPAGPVTAPGPRGAAGQPVPARSPESSGGLG